MLAKSWKKICLFILIIACLWNIISKIVDRISFDETVNSVKENYEQKEDNTNIA